MALEGILGSLTLQKGDRIYASPKYNSKTLKDSVDKLDELKNYDLSNPEDLKKNEKLTGDKAKDYSPEMLSARRTWRVSVGQTDLSMYVNKHYGEILKEVKEPNQLELAFKYCPTQDASAKSKEYEAVRKAVTASKEIVRRISEEPKKFILEAIKNEEPYMRRYVAMYQEEFLEISKKYAVKRAMETLNKYGAAKFLGNTKAILDSAQKEIREKKGKLEESVRKELETAAQKKGQPLSAEEEAKIIYASQNKFTKLSEDYKDSRLLAPLTRETVAYATGLKDKVNELLNPAVADSYALPRLEAEKSKEAAKAQTPVAAPTPKAKEAEKPTEAPKAKAAEAPKAQSTAAPSTPKPSNSPAAEVAQPSPKAKKKEEATQPTPKVEAAPEKPKSPAPKVEVKNEEPKRSASKRPFENPIDDEEVKANRIWEYNRKQRGINEGKLILVENKGYDYYGIPILVVQGEENDILPTPKAINKKN
jgi:hypothetical protein